MLVFYENVLSVFDDICHFGYELLRVVHRVFGIDLHDTTHLNLNVAYREAQALPTTVGLLVDLWYIHLMV